MARKTRITPCLWFASEALEAAKYYVRIFRNSKVRKIMRYGKAGQEQHRQKPGSVLMVEFELDGRPFTALNGGPIFKFNEAVSLQVYCKDQKEVDYYWKKLGAGGDPAAQVCGWLKDRYGLSWQIVPTRLYELIADPSPARAAAATRTMMGQRKIVIAEIEAAADLA
jgi:predicted 3-demethylubiquinone-9 3-methyltransferase (glyoxalase superfamily)